MKTLVLAFVFFAAVIALVAATAEPPRPIFPPSAAYQVDYTYDVQFFDATTEATMTGL